MKKILCFFILVFFALGLAGCWSRREIEDLGIVAAIGIDRVKKEERKDFKLSLFLIRTDEVGGQKGSGERNPEWLASETGPTLYDAQREFNVRSPRTLRMFHSDLAIIGESTAKEGLGEIIDYLLRHKDIRQRVLVFVSIGDAHEVMSALPALETTVSQEISEVLIKAIPQVSKSYPVDLKGLTEALLVPGWDAVCPVVKVFTPPEGRDPRAQKEPPQTVLVEGLAVFKKDKLTGFLSPEETKGFLYLAGKAQRGVIPARVTGQHSGEISFLMKQASSEIKPIIKDARLIIEIIIKAEADIGEVAGKIPVGDPKVIKQLNQVFSAQVQALTENTMKKAQKQYKSDILGLGNKVHKKYPDYWRGIEKEWDKIYSEVPVFIKVEGQVRGTLELADPVQIK